MITLVLGGTRSGKSVVAERLVLAHAGPLGYLATGTPTDIDMSTRIEWHRRRRDDRFATVEAGAELAAALRQAPPLPTLVDALGTWVAAQSDFCAPPITAATDPFAWPGDPANPPDPATATDLPRAWTTRIDELCQALVGRSAPTVLVSDEVGMGVHPETEIGRQFRDVLGLVNQRVAEIADDVLLVVAGRALHLDRLPATDAPSPSEPPDPPESGSRAR
jgi:adenosyl cobinamide kinase/adenosyl cobinamide phosphate guanylyltransferase